VAIRKFPDDIMSYFADLAMEGMVMPIDFYTEWELKRFEFSYFGTFKYRWKDLLIFKKYGTCQIQIHDCCGFYCEDSRVPDDYETER
jgi:hypothetical protein